MKNKIRNLLLVFVCLLMVCLVSACNTSDTSGGNTDASQPVNNTPPVNVQLNTAVYTEGCTAKFEVVYVYGNDEIESYILWCDAEVTDFHIVGVTNNDGKWTTNGVRLLEIETLKTNEVLVYNQMVPEGMPMEAVIYTANGVTYRYAIGYNGRVGGIDLIEIDRLYVVADGADESEENTTTAATTTTSASATTAATTTVAVPEDFMTTIYWVSEDDSIFPREMTIESNSKWHVWKALKNLNKDYIPSKCSLISGDMLLGRDGIMVLNFSSDFSDVTTAMNGRLVLQAIANTYVETYDINAVRFQIDGDYFETAVCGYAEEFGYIDV